MSKLMAMTAVMISSALKAGHYRAGQRFDPAGAIFFPDAFDEKQWALIEKDMRLRARPATEEEIEAATAAIPAAGDGADQVLDELMRIIPELPSDAYGKGGAPLIKHVRKAAADIDDDDITGELLDEAFERLVKGGFTPPSKPT